MFINEIHDVEGTMLQENNGFQKKCLFWQHVSSFSVESLARLWLSQDIGDSSRSNLQYTLRSFL